VLVAPLFSPLSLENFGVIFLSVLRRASEDAKDEVASIDDAHREEQENHKGECDKRFD